MEPEIQVIYLLCLGKEGYRAGDRIPNNKYGDIIRNMIKNAPRDYFGERITVDNVRGLLLNIFYYKANKKGKKDEQRYSNDLQANG